MLKSRALPSAQFFGHHMIEQHNTRPGATPSASGWRHSQQTANGILGGVPASTGRSFIFVDVWSFIFVDVDGLQLSQQSQQELLLGINEVVI